MDVSWEETGVMSGVTNPCTATVDWFVRCRLGDYPETGGVAEASAGAMGKLLNLLLKKNIMTADEFFDVIGIDEETRKRDCYQITGD